MEKEIIAEEPKKNNKLFTTGDPITWLFKNKYQVNTFLATILVQLILILPLIIVASKENILIIPDSKLIGLFEDFPFWLMITSQPFTIFFYLWMPKGIKGIFNGLINNQVILTSSNKKKNKKEIESFLLKFDTQYSNKIWVVLSFVAMTYYVLTIINPGIPSYFWVRLGGRYLFLHHTFQAVVIFSMVTLMVIRIFILIYWLNQLFRKFDINVRVLHPDGAGGLSPLGIFSVKLGYLLGIYGVSVTAIMLGNSYIQTGQLSSITWDIPVIFTLSVYVFLSPIAFFAPIGAARTGMKKAREDFILKISNQYEIETENVHALLISEGDELKKRLEKIKHIKDLYKEAKEFPVWPFNTENLVKFFSSVSSPLIMWVLSVIIDIVLKK